jgi:hypothetical protein
MKYFTINKKNVFNLLVVCLVAIAFSACERDKCVTRGTVCKNQGVCFEGKCNCPLEFDGDSCQFAANKKYVGRFEGVLVDHKGYATDDTITVVQGTTNLDINWMHIRLVNVGFKGKIKNNDVTIAPFVAANGYTYKGSGSLNKDIFTLTMQADSFFGGISLKSATYTFAGNRIE